MGNNANLTNPFTSKAQTWQESIDILNEVDDGFGKKSVLDQTREYFEDWTDNEFDGDFDEFLASGLVSTTEIDGIEGPVPIVESQFGNHYYLPNLHKWVDDDGLEEHMA